MQNLIISSVCILRNTKRLQFLLLCMCFLLIGNTAISWAVEYRIRDLGTLGGDGSLAFDVNDNGQVVGVASRAGNNYAPAFLWQNGSMQDLGTLGESPQSVATGINNSGQVVGYSEGGHAFLWQNGSMQDLGVNATNVAINDNGQVVGSLGGPSFLWQNGSMQNLGNKMPNDINNAGQVVGWGYNSHAFLWQIGLMLTQDLGTLYGGNSEAYAINNIGQVVGVSDNHGFLWQNGLMQDIGFLRVGYDINDIGQVVGWAGDAAGNNHPFLWQNGSIQFLDTLGGLKNSKAYAINNNGLIVGYSTDAAGNQHAVLWEPVPEPSSLAVLVLGLFPLIGAARGRWRRK
ncbi:MAG: DUF3466 family protein [Armatimonadota bacterium]|nr:DUF3466 family protein [Armatimonadota bacterium]